MNALSAIDTSQIIAPALRILVADDDPPSRLFLSVSLQRLGHSVVDCADGLAAIELGRQQRFDLLLLDCRMPGAGALEVLLRLREDPTARSSDSPAIATSAELGAPLRASLLDAGFEDVLVKPCSIEQLNQLTRQLGDESNRPQVLDDAAAMAASADENVLRALRGLLHEELVVFYQEMDGLLSHPTELAERLHRLRASCGFCGAPRLAARARDLQQRLRGNQRQQEAVNGLRQSLLETLDALGPSTG